jgi:hypothetical protein
MSTIHTPVTPSTSTRSLVPIGALVALVASAATAYGAHTWAEIVITVPVIVAAAALVFGWVVPKALRKESVGGTALSLSILAALLLLPAFWAGVPFVLGVAGVIVGNAGRTARTGSGKSIAGLALGALVVVGYLAIYAIEIASGTAGFLFD